MFTRISSHVFWKRAADTATAHMNELYSLPKCVMPELFH